MDKNKHKKMNVNLLSVPGVFPVCSRSRRNLLVYSIGKKGVCSRSVPGFGLFLKIRIKRDSANCEKLPEFDQHGKNGKFWSLSRNPHLKKCQNREQPGTENGVFDQPPGTLNGLVLWSLASKNTPVPGVPGENMTFLFSRLFLRAFWGNCEKIDTNPHFLPQD